MSTPGDRRRSARLRIAACAALETVGARNENNQGLGTVRDVSRTGIGLETGQPPRAGQLVRLRISLDDEIREVTARATRVTRVGQEHFHHVGLDWTDCDAEQLAFLERVFAAAEELYF